MAQVSLTKLAPTKSVEAKTITIHDTPVQVIQYLPMIKKSAMVQDIITDVLDSNGVTSILREKLYSIVYIVKYYTNINITENMLNDASKTYDLLTINSIAEEVLNNIPEDELNLVKEIIHETLATLMSYKLSAAGLLDRARSEQNSDLVDIEEMNKKLEEITNNGLLQEVLEGLG